MDLMNNFFELLRNFKTFFFCGTIKLRFIDEVILCFKIVEQDFCI